jgi:hypothetical protein
MAAKLPAPPTEAADVAMAAENRAHVARQERPIDLALNNASVLSGLAIIGARRARG